MTQDRVMLLIDADNVSVDVMEQAVKLLLNQHGAVHVRRAYCTAEGAMKHQAVFKHLGIKPMVNLAAGKNSTDIALAVDAIDLVLAERPDVVVIASSDSDFAPLVQRLREKGCVVRGIGQHGKTGDETQGVYDDYTVLEHRKSASSEAMAKPARKTAARKTTPAAAKKTPAAKKTATKTVAAKTPARKTTPRRAAPAALVEPPVQAPQPVPPKQQPKQQPQQRPQQQPQQQPQAQPQPEPAPRRGRGTSVDAVLDCLPELAAGQGLALNVAVQRLREGQLLGKNSSSLKLFAQLSDRFELLPADKPTQVRLRR